MGRFFSLETPLAPGPLHCGQFASSSPSANNGMPGRPHKQTIKMGRRPDVIRLNNPDLISIKERLRIEVIYESAVRTVKLNHFGRMVLQRSILIYLASFLLSVWASANWYRHNSDRKTSSAP